MKLRSSLLSLLVCAAAAPLHAEPPRSPAEMTVQQIQDCVQHNFPSESMVQRVKMVSIDRMSVERVLEAEMYWQRDTKTQLSSVLLTFDNPPELRGASVLVLEKKPTNDMFMFLPELGKVRRITTQMVQGNMMGTDFSYEDFQRLQGMITSLETKRLPDETVGDRPAFLTESTPSDPSSEYSRIRTKIDQQTCVPLVVELYTKGDPSPAKVMSTDPKSYSRVKTGWFPLEVAMKDMRTETATRIVIDKLQVNVPIDRKHFSVAELERKGRFSGAPTH